MKIVIIGFSGSGKSTLAKNLGKHYNIPILHMDAIHFKEGWQERDKEEFSQIVRDFMSKNSSWIIDGNYHKIVPERIMEADMLFFLNYNRLTCLKGVLKRYKDNKGKTRSDMAHGCEEKIDLEFIKWVLYKGRNKIRKERLLDWARNHKNGIIFKNRKQLFNFYEKNNIKFDK